MLLLHLPALTSCARPVNARTFVRSEWRSLRCLVPYKVGLEVTDIAETEQVAT